MKNYYNEINPHAAAWLRELIKAGHIAPGIVDERSIVDVSADDLRGFRQCHFFAGIGVWSHALRKAGWSDDREVWTGSCPCQPFSDAGKGSGFDDQRHLWPAWYRLIKKCCPAKVFGEQVASADGLNWLDLVHTDLEASGYAFGAADLCSAGIGAPHIRQRLWFVADFLAACEFCGYEFDHETLGRYGCPNCEGSGRVGNASAVGLQGRLPGGARPEWKAIDGSAGCNGTALHEHPAPINGIWRDPDWLFCRDGKWRPVEPGTFPLADGAPARMVRLRGYGNAINAEAATTFIRAAAGVA
ncbi:MAG: DNA cytosine methyltransferase [bacterium]|nr:DNA cytosine methyltransferase [bacterium]